MLGRTTRCLVLALGAFVAPSQGAAQVAEYAAGPRFLTVVPEASMGAPRLRDASRAAVLQRRIALNLGRVSLRQALAAIEEQSGLRLTYSRDIVALDSPVTLTASDLTVGAALSAVLYEADVDVLLTSNTSAALVRRGAWGEPPVGAISGRVTDAKTGQAIGAVSVRVEGNTLGATTTDDGAYRIPDVPAGIHTVRAWRIGYEPQSRTVTVIADQESSVDFALAVSATPLDAVVVTGTVVPSERKVIPTPITVISGAEIEQRGYERVDQIFRGDVPGSIAWENGWASRFSDITARGANSFFLNTIKTYVDGIEVASDQYLTLDPRSIDRVEILRGPQGSTIYGSDASGGVLQIFTKKGQAGLAAPRLNVTMSAGEIQSAWVGKTTVQQDHALELVGGGPDMSYRLGASYFGQGAWLPDLQTHNNSLTGGLRTRQGRLAVEVSARYSNRTTSLPSDPRLADSAAAHPDTLYTFFAKPYNTTNVLNQQTFGVALAYDASPHWRQNLTLGYDVFAETQSKDAPRLTTPSDTLLSITKSDGSKASVAYNASYTGALAGMQSTLTTGADHWTYQSGGFGASATPTVVNAIRPDYATRAQYDNTGWFAQEQLGLSNSLFFTAGLRAERNNNYGKSLGTDWSPRVGVSYVKVFGAVTAKARLAFGKATRPPQPFQAVKDSEAFFTQVANPNLGPERQVGTDGGLEAYFGARGSLEVTYYDQTAIDLIGVVKLPNTTRYVYQYQNVGRIRNTGWEFVGRWRIGQVTLGGTYSITSSVVEKLSPTYSGALQVGDQMLKIPQHLAGATVTYVSRLATVSLTGMRVGSWTASDYLAYYGLYFGRQPYRGSDRDYWMQYPAFTKVDLTATRAITGHLSVFLRAANLTNSKAFERDNLNLNVGRVTTLGVHTQF